MILLESKAPHGLARGEALAASILVLALATFSPHALARGVQPADSARSQGSLRIEIDSPMTIEDAELLRTRIVERSRESASAPLAGIDGHAQWIDVRITGVKFAYFVSATGMREGKPEEPTAEPVECRCNSEELLAEVEARVSAAAQALRTPAADPSKLASPRFAPPEALTDELGPIPPREPAPTDVEPGGPRRRAMGPLGYSGIGLGILGAGTLGAGIALILRPDEIRGEREEASRSTTKPPGIAMAAGGSAAIATGVVLITLDLVRGRRRSTSFVPTLERHAAGLSITRRF